MTTIDGGLCLCIPLFYTVLTILFPSMTIHVDPFPIFSVFGLFFIYLFIRIVRRVKRLRGVAEETMDGLVSATVKGIR